MEFIEVSAKTVDDAITEACRKLTVSSDKLEYVVVEQGSTGFLGFNAKPAIIKAKVKSSIEDVAKNFLNELFEKMNYDVVSEIEYNEEEGTMHVELKGDEMGALIGKRGQTLDSIQCLVKLVVNKNTDKFIRVAVDTENYRQRRKETLENLAKNISYKVKRTRRPVTLEPMNSYERRIIHSALQNDKYVRTHSEGEGKERRVIVSFKRN